MIRVLMGMHAPPQDGRIDAGLALVVPGAERQVARSRRQRLVIAMLKEIPMFAGILLAGLGLVSLWGARYWMRLRRQVNTWPVVRGRVTVRQTIQPSDRGRTSTPAFRWAPDVRFTYRVGDTDYVGDKIWLPWSWTHTKTSAEAFLATLPDEVEVRYDPTNPQTSCLYPPPYGNVLWYGIPGLVLLGVGGLILLVHAIGGTP